MNRKKNGSATKNRSYRKIKLAPTTRAIRSALALSAAMLALSGTGAALAGTCSISDPLEVTCTGDFTNDVANDVPALAQVPDLTLILDEDTTVNPGAGDNGITSDWGGDPIVISYAEINVIDAIGIYVYTNDGSAS